MLCVAHMTRRRTVAGDEPDPRALLEAYDAQLRAEAEVSGSQYWDRSGPLFRAVFTSEGFVSYRSLEGIDDVDGLIAATVAFFAGLPQVEEFEWKTRGHDWPPDLGDRLEAHGFVPEEIETVMVGEASLLAQDIELPAGVTVRRVDHVPDCDALIRAAATMQRDVFGAGHAPDDAVAHQHRMADVEEFWVAEAEGQVISAGRIQRVTGTEFAGLWGGATRPDWRGRGVYRALTAARARSALEHGVRYLHSDCTAMSRPILERSGLVAVTTTTPYLWHRPTPD
jgi:hypothetical protein